MGLFEYIHLLKVLEYFTFWLSILGTGNAENIRILLDFVSFLSLTLTKTVLLKKYMYKYNPFLYEADIFFLNEDCIALYLQPNNLSHRGKFGVATVDI